MDSLNALKVFARAAELRHQLHNRLRLAIEEKFLGMVRSNLSEDTRRRYSSKSATICCRSITREIEARLRKQ